MALRGAFGRVDAVSRAMKSLAKPGSTAQAGVIKAVGVALKRQIKKQFATSTGPDDEPWAPRKDGKPSLASKKLASRINLKVAGTGLRGWSRIPWLEAHQEGHVFPSRRGAAQWLRFNKKGRLVKAKRFEKLKRGRAVLGRAHVVGQRVLPARPIRPVGGMTAPWAAAVNAGAREGMRAWYARAAR